jgi:hypothetical protein
MSELDFETDASYEQILYALLAGIKGAVTPVAQAAGADGQLWTFTPPPTADPAPDAFTLEYVEREGLTNIQQITATYGLCSRLKLAGSSGAEYVTMEQDWFARKSVSKANTASIGVPVRNLLVAPKVQVKTGTSFANLESAPTLVDATVISWEWEVITGIKPIFRVDDNSPDFAKYGFDVRETTLKLELDWVAFTETERTAQLQAAGVRYIRVQSTGPAIGAAFHQLKIDGCYEVTNPIGSGDDDDGQSKTDIEYTAVHDSTKGAAFEVVVQNTLTAAP